MADPIHEFYFSSNRSLSLNVTNLFLLVDFQSNFFVQFLVHSEMHDSVGPLTDFVANNVIVHAMLVGENNFLCGLLFLRFIFLLFFHGSCTLVLHVILSFGEEVVDSRVFARVRARRTSNLVPMSPDLKRVLRYLLGVLLKLLTASLLETPSNLPLASLAVSCLHRDSIVPDMLSSEVSALRVGG